MNKKISVIIPIYNSSQTLERTINSVINQTYKNLEIILVNDGSTDDSIKICKKYAEKDNRIIILNQENKGVGEARNHGIDVSTGDFISFVDSDDTMDENLYKELIATQIVTNADIVESGAKVVLGKDNEIFPYEKNDKIIIYENHDYMKNYLNFSLNVSVWGKIYKRELIGDIRFPNLNINEDFVFLWEIVKRTNLFCENLNVNYHYYLDKEVSLSKAPFSSNNMIMISHIEDVVNDVNNISPDLNKTAKNHYNACLLHTMILYYLYLKSKIGEELFIEERDEMLEKSENMEPITSYLLLHEAEYDVEKLRGDIKTISEIKRGIKK